MRDRHHTGEGKRVPSRCVKYIPDILEVNFKPNRNVPEGTSSTNHRLTDIG